MTKQLLPAATALVFIAFAAQAQTGYSAPTWAEAVKTLPCDAFEKISPDSWTQTRTISINGLATENKMFINTAESRALDERCRR
jgi:hypothetical protein